MNRYRPSRNCVLGCGVTQKKIIRHFGQCFWCNICHTLHESQCFWCNICHTLHEKNIFQLLRNHHISQRNRPNTKKNVQNPFFCILCQKFYWQHIKISSHILATDRHGSFDIKWHILKLLYDEMKQVFLLQNIDPDI